MIFKIFLIYYLYWLRVVNIFARIFGEHVFWYLFSETYLGMSASWNSNIFLKMVWNKKNISLGTAYTFVVHFWLLEIALGTT